jgi:hypothetical protein
MVPQEVAVEIWGEDAFDRFARRYGWASARLVIAPVEAARLARHAHFLHNAGFCSSSPKFPPTAVVHRNSLPRRATEPAKIEQRLFALFAE